MRTVDDGASDGEIEVRVLDGYRDSDGTAYCDFTFRLPNGEDEEAANALRDDNPARQRDALITRCLLSVDGLEPRRMRALGVKLLADLSMGDRRLIARRFDEAVPGPDLSREVVCDRCGEDYKQTLDMSNFFDLE